MTLRFSVRLPFAAYRLVCTGQLVRLVAALLAAIGLAIFVSTAAVAAELSLLDFEARNDPTQLNFQPVCNAKLSYKIDPGDYEDEIKPKFDRFVAEPRVAPVLAAIDAQLDKVPQLARGEAAMRGVDHRFYALCLDSPGGDLKEAFKIARLFEGWMMVVDLDLNGNGVHCTSACAVILMSAKRRDGVFRATDYRRYPGRFLHYKAQLGFHAPDLELPENRPTVTREEAEAAYNKAILSVRELMRMRQSGSAHGTLDAVEESLGLVNEDFPPDALATMLTTPNSDMHWIDTLGEATRWGIDVYGYEPPKVLTDRMLITACANVAVARCQRGGGLDRCADDLVTESLPLNTVRYGGGVTAAGVGPLASVDAERQRIAKLATEWPLRRFKIWQGAASGASIDAALAETDERFGRRRRPCALKVTWRADHLANLEMQTFNGAETLWLRPPEQSQKLGLTDAELADTVRAVETSRYRADSLFHTRLVRLLPPPTPLSALSASPWTWFEAGRNLFDRKIDWRPSPGAGPKPP